MMKLRKIYSRHFPVKGYVAITILWWMVIREEYRGMLPWYVENHETIHLRQEIEMGFVLFYVVYAIEWFLKLLVTWDFKRAYMSISMEQEAYAFQYDNDYPERRSHYAWVRYVFKLNKKEK